MTQVVTQSSAPEDDRDHRPKHVELTGIINKPLLLHLVGCLYYLYQWWTVKRISDYEIYLLIKYIKSVLWRVAKCLSYREDARCLKVNLLVPTIWRWFLDFWEIWKPLVVVAVGQFCIQYWNMRTSWECEVRPDCSYCAVVLGLQLLVTCTFHVAGSIYRRGARRWRKLYRVNGHIFQAKRFNRVSSADIWWPAARSQVAFCGTGPHL